MITEIDAALRSLVRAEVLRGSNDIGISFDQPDGEWAAQQNAPTFNLYLYDVSENLARREMTYEPVRDQGGRVTERRPPPRRFDLAYLVSAWTQRVEDEHGLMDDILVCLLSHEVLPREHLSDELAGQPLPVRVVAGRPRPDVRKATDVWNALGGTLKPSIDLVVTTPFVTRRSRPAGPPVLETPRFDFVGDEDEGSDVEHRAAPPARRRHDATTAADRHAITEEVIDGGRTEGDDAHPGRRFRVRGLPRR